MKILVTGCGGDIGQSVGKILLNSFDSIELHGIDISDKNAAKFIFPYFKLAPRVTNVEYIPFIRNYVIKNHIDLIIPVSEPELRQFTLQKWNAKILGSKVLMANYKARKVGFDKMGTIGFLAKNQFPHPLTKHIKYDKENIPLPVIFKSRTGSGSKSIFEARNLKSYNLYKKLLDNQDFIIQELIPSEEGEYTCGLFRSRNGEIRSIIFSRELTGGYSSYGELVESEIISKLLKQIGIKLNLRGSINIQLRIKDGIPYIFEINPRFSSTVYFRHLFGFNDVIWSIADLLEIKLPPYKKDNRAKRFYKGFNEYTD